MPSVKRAHTKLLKSGYISVSQSEEFERWVDVSSAKSLSISFYKSHDGERVSSFKVEAEDKPEFDLFESHYTVNLSRAIAISRVAGKF